MPTSYTSNLRLSNPGLGDTGWGSTVSNGMIDLVDPAIAGTTTLSADTDVILTTANGMADQARQMILNCTGSRAAQRTITAPASSKVYVVINGTTGGFGVKIVGVGPTTGVVVPAGRMAVVAWNGSDFVTLGAVVNLHVAGQTRIQDSASASNYILIGSGTNAPRGGNSVMAQTGSMVMGTEAASSLFFVTNAATAMTLDASGNLGVGTTSPTGAKVVIEGPASAPSVFNALALRNSLDGSVALIFDNSAATTLASIEALITSTGAGTDDGVLAFGTALNGVNAERMRLDASGNLGIGTTSPATRLEVLGASEGEYFRAGGGTVTGRSLQFSSFTVSGLAGVGHQINVPNVSGVLTFATNSVERMRLDASGNLGLGVTPSAWGASWRVLETEYASAGSVFAGLYPVIAANGYNDGTNWLYKTTAAASYYSQVTGQHRWYTAPSGTAGNTISFTQAMTLDASGDFLLGTASAPANGASARNVVFNNANSASTFVKIANAASGATASDGFDLIMGTSSDAYVYNRENGPLIFGTNNTERARITGSGDFIHQVNGTAPSLSTNSTMSFELTSNTSLKVVVRGTDGVTRSASLTLS